MLLCAIMVKKYGNLTIAQTFTYNSSGFAVNDDNDEKCIFCILCSVGEAFAPMQLLNQRYEIVSRLAKGGMGVVYKAVDNVLKRQVAIKEMSQKGLEREELARVTQALQQEAWLLANLHHQNLPRIFDFFMWHETAFLVMELIEGETLDEVLQQARGEGLLVEEVLLIGDQLSAVLGYLHSQQPPVIFRDLKPANVMLTNSGDHLYLIDFGIARFFKVGQFKDTLAFGTPGYAPPEQYGAQTTERSDIYSLGATLHQLLTGRDPSKSETPFHFPSVLAYNPAIPIALDRLLAQMLETDPARRPDSMQFIRHELQAIRRDVQRTAILRSTGEIERIVIPSIVPVPPTPAKPAPGTTLLTYRGHTDSVFRCAWSPDGQYIASCGRDKTVCVWHTATGETAFTYKKHITFVYSVAWSPDGSRIASSSFRKVHLWDATTGGNMVEYGDHAFWVYSISWSPDGLFLVTGGGDGEVHLVNAMSGTNIYKYKGYAKDVWSVAWSQKPESALIVSGSDDRSLRSWDATIGSTPVVYHGHEKEVRSVAWSPDETMVVSGSRDRTVKLWQVATGKEVYTYRGHNKELHAVAWSPDGTTIASAGEDRTVRLWKAATGETIHIYRGHTREVYALAWSPDGTRIASCSDDRTIHIWQAI